MPTKSSSASSSKEKNEALKFDLRLYVESEDQMLPIHKIDDELMPAVLHHVSKLKSSVPETQRTLLEHLDGVKSDLIDVRDAIGKLKSLERLLNVQMKELVRVDLGDISKEVDAIAEERQMNSTTSESGNPSDSLDDSEKSKPLTVIQIRKELSELAETIPKLKETLNLNPKVSPSAGSTIIQHAPLTKPSESMEGISLFPSFAKSLDIPLPSTMSRLSAFKEIRMLYDSLEVRLTLCLLCFSAFPDNSVINKRALTYWWIGEGFIESPDSRAKTVENTADELLKELMAKGFIQPVYRKRYPMAHRYKMHPSIRFMVVMLAQKAGFFDIDLEGNFLTDSAKSCKACLVRTEEGSSQHTLRDCPDLKDLVTLFNVNESYLDLQSHWFSKLKNVKVLQLGRWQSSTKHHIEVGNTDFLSSLSNMKYLRYLSLQGISRIQELPVSFSNHPNMRVLDLRACHNLHKLPDGIGKLKNLTHLDMSECYMIGHMPQELALLSEFQVLKGFVIGDTKSNEDACTLTDMSGLSKLRKLSLSVSGETSATKGELFNNLPRFTALCSLTIAWVGIPLPAPRRAPLLNRLVTMKPQSKGRSTAGAANTNILTSLGNLKKLELQCFPWTRMAAPLDPVGLRSLKKLYIVGGELCNLHHVDNPWNVEVLRLKYLCKLGMSWEKLQASFPQLTYLEKVGCPKLSLYPCDGRGVWMRK